MEHNNREYFYSENIHSDDDLTFSIKKINASDKVTEVTVNFPLI